MSYCFCKKVSCKLWIGSGPSLVKSWVKLLRMGRERYAGSMLAGAGWLAASRRYSPLSLRLYLPTLLPSLLLLLLLLLTSILSLTFPCLRFASSFPPKFLPSILVATVLALASASPFLYRCISAKTFSHFSLSFFFLSFFFFFGKII